MRRIEIYRALRKHVKLSEKRSLSYEQNRTAMILGYIMVGFLVMYMMFIAVMLALIANSSDTEFSYELFYALAPIFITLDFYGRFIGQQTPSQLTKPYLLLPLPRYACVESFILSSIITPNNLLWMFLTVPYAIMSIVFSYGLWTAVAFVVSFQLLVVINSQNYMFWRTLATRSILWHIPPILIYGSMFLPWILDEDFDFFGSLGRWLSTGNPLAWLVALLVLVCFFLLNRRMQYHFTYADTTGTAEKNLRSVSEFRQLDRFGQIGEYIKLEIKSIMRNKNMRNSFLYSTIFTIILSLIIAYTDIYDGAYMSRFWIVYVFIINGAMLLSKIMGAEGNYIDCLMVHHENILQLLHAKYYFYCSLLLLPLLLMIPTVFMGKYTILMLISMAIFAAGPIYCSMMQMAVWNKQTIPLNSKLISRGNVETNWFAVIMELAVMFLPVILLSLLPLLFSETVTYIIMLVIGVVFIATRNLWIRNIYNRFMARRYSNMESFRATR